MLSLTGEYALRAMVCLARNKEEWPLSGPRIAEEAGVPSKYLSAILADLVRAGLLEGTRGKGGGFRLTRPPKRISLAEIVRSFEPISAQRKTCPFGNTVCSDENPCRAHEQWKHIKTVFEDFLKGTTLDDVAARQEPAGGSKRRIV